MMHAIDLTLYRYHRNKYYEADSETEDFCDVSMLKRRSPVDLLDVEDNPKQLLYSEVVINNFAKKLLDNNVFDSGFQFILLRKEHPCNNHENSLKIDKNIDCCTCLCSFLMEPWQRAVELSNMFIDNTHRADNEFVTARCSHGSYFDPKSFYIVLKTKQLYDMDPFNFLLLLYIENLYRHENCFSHINWGGKLGKI